MAQSILRMATGWLAEKSEFQSRYGQEIFLSKSSRSVLGPTQTPNQWVPGALSKRAKRTRDADH
jgi:hypothetical protein